MTTPLGRELAGYSTERIRAAAELLRQEMGWDELPAILQPQTSRASQPPTARHATMDPSNNADYATTGADGSNDIVVTQDFVADLAIGVSTRAVDDSIEYRKFTSESDEMVIRGVQVKIVRGPGYPRRGRIMDIEPRHGHTVESERSDTGR